MATTNMSNQSMENDPDAWPLVKPGWWYKKIDYVLLLKCGHRDMSDRQFAHGGWLQESFDDFKSHYYRRWHCIFCHKMQDIVEVVYARDVPIYLG